MFAAAFDKERRFQEWQAQHDAAVEGAGGGPLSAHEAAALRGATEELLAALLDCLRGGAFAGVLTAQVPD